MLFIILAVIALGVIKYLFAPVIRLGKRFLRVGTGFKKIIFWRKVIVTVSIEEFPLTGCDFLVTSVKCLSGEFTVIADQRIILSGMGAVHSHFQPLCSCDKNGSRLGAFMRPDDSVFLELVNNPSGAGVADA